MSEQNLRVIAQYLDGDLSYEGMSAVTGKLSNASSSSVWCYIPPPPPPKVSTTTRPSKGFTSSSGRVDRHAMFYVGSSTFVRAPVVDARRSSERWTFSPDLRITKQSKGCLLPLECAWVEVLCRLVQRTLYPLLHFHSSKEWVNTAIDSEINARRASYHFMGPYSFFSHFGNATAWLFASEWDHWEQAGVAMNDRPKFLSKHVDLRIKEIDVYRMNPAAIAAQLRGGDVELPFTGNSLKHVPEGFKSSIPEMQLINDASEEAAVRSKGGPPFERAKSFKPLPTGHIREQDLEQSDMWWWRRLCHADHKEELQKFLQRWEESAFMYEYRARRHYLERSPDWEGFSRPWNELDHTQKGILYYLFPPKLNNGFWPEGFPRSQTDYIKFMIKVDFAQPLDNLLNHVKAKWRELEPELVHLWGLTKTPEIGGSAKSLRHDPLKLPARWSLLEAMDRNQYLKNCMFSTQDHSLKSRQEEYYLKACKNAGIDS